jgi:hypothetical protein
VLNVAQYQERPSVPASSINSDANAPGLAEAADDLPFGIAAGEPVTRKTNELDENPVGFAGPLTEERHLWACANMVLNQHAHNAARFVAERIGALALAGDQSGVATWKAIAQGMDQLIRHQGPLQ